MKDEGTQVIEGPVTVGEPLPPPAPEPEPEVPQEASSDDLDVRTWRWVDLPALGKRVAVRVLDVDELTELAMLPELEEFTKLMEREQRIVEANEKRDQDKPEQKLSETERRAYVREQQTYLRRLVHIAVARDPEAPAGPCADCDFEHVPSLWTLTQVRRLGFQDRRAIGTIAEGRELDPTSDGSEDQTEPDTPSAPESTA